MKKIMISIGFLRMLTMEASESIAVENRMNLRLEFILEIIVHYEKMNKGLKSFEPKGSERRDREDNFIVQAEQQNENIKYHIQSLSVDEVWKLFQVAYSNSKGPIKYVVINPTIEDRVVFDSLHLPLSFACYLKSQQQN